MPNRSTHRKAKAIKLGCNRRWQVVRLKLLNNNEANHLPGSNPRRPQPSISLAVDAAAGVDEEAGGEETIGTGGCTAGREGRAC